MPQRAGERQLSVKLKVSSAMENHALHRPFAAVRIMKSALKEKFSISLFTVTIGSNDLFTEQEYTEQQHQNYELIKSLHDRGMGYRKIAKYLNEQGIKTVRGNTWKNTQVFSVLKKYRARQERIQNVRLKEHPIEISKFELQWIKDI